MDHFDWWYTPSNLFSLLCCIWSRCSNRKNKAHSIQSVQSLYSVNWTVFRVRFAYKILWLLIEYSVTVYLFNTEHLLYQNQKILTIKVCILCLKKCAVHLQLTFDRGVYQLKLNRLKSHPMIMVNNNAMLSIFITSESTSLGTLSVWVMVVSKMNANDFLNCFFPKGSIVTFKMIHMNRWKR